MCHKCIKIKRLDFVIFRSVYILRTFNDWIISTIQRCELRSFEVCKVRSIFANFNFIAKCAKLCTYKWKYSICWGFYSLVCRLSLTIDKIGVCVTKIIICLGIYMVWWLFANFSKTKTKNQPVQFIFKSPLFFIVIMDFFLIISFVKSSSLVAVFWFWRFNLKR